MAVALALAVAWWQYKEALRAKLVLASTRNELTRLVADALCTILKSAQRDSGTPADLNRSGPGVVDYVDVDADGQEEMLVQYPSGAHGCALRILGWRQGRFEEIGYLSVGTPVGFEFGDFDRDGRIEIKTQETDWGAGLPYAAAPRVVLILRWDGRGFAEVSRERLPESATP